MARDWSLVEDVFFARDTPGRIEWFNNPFFNIQEFTVPACMIFDRGNRNQSLLVPPTMKVAWFQLNPGVITSDTRLKNTFSYNLHHYQASGFNDYFDFHPRRFPVWQIFIYVYIYIYIHMTVYVYTYFRCVHTRHDEWRPFSDLSPNSLMSIKRWRDFGRGAVLWSGGLLGMRIQGVFIDQMKWGCFPSNEDASHLLKKSKALTTLKNIKWCFLKQRWNSWTITITKDSLEKIKTNG